MSNDPGLAWQWQKRTGNNDIDVLVYIDNRSSRDNATDCVIWNGPMSSDKRPTFGKGWKERAKTATVAKFILRIRGTPWPEDGKQYKVVQTCSRTACIAFDHLRIAPQRPPVPQRFGYYVPQKKFALSTFHEFKKKQAEGADYRELARFLRVSHHTVYRYIKGDYDTYYKKLEEQRESLRTGLIEGSVDVCEKSLPVLTL